MDVYDLIVAKRDDEVLLDPEQLLCSMVTVSMIRHELLPDFQNSEALGSIRRATWWTGDTALRFGQVSIL